MVSYNGNSESEQLAKIKKMINVAEQGRAGLIERAITGKDFYEGRHWTTDELRLYDKKKITPLTINHCFPAINSVSGLQRQSRRDIKVRHRKDSSAHLAGVYTELIKHTNDVCYGHYITSETFKRGIISGEDWLKVTIEDDGSPGGYISIGRVSVFNAFPDPTCEDYDINKGGKFFVERKWVIKEEIDNLYPDKKPELGSPGLYEQTEDPDLDRMMDIFYGEEENIEADQIEFRQYKYRVMYVWYLDIVPAVNWYDLETEEVRVVWGKDMAKAKKAAKGSDRFEVTNTSKRILHKCTMVGGVKLEDEESPMGEKIDFLPFCRFSPYFEDGYTFGMIDNLVGPQKEENINRTQATRIVNQTANSGFIVDKINNATRRVLQLFGSLPGMILSRKDYGNIQKIEPNQLSTAHVALGERAGQDIKEISQVNSQLQGNDTNRAESGRALAIKTRQGQMGIEPVLDNLDRTLKLMGWMIVELVRGTDVYTDNEIRSIIDESKLITQEVLIEAEKRFPLQPQIEQPNPTLMAIMSPEDQQQIMQAQQQHAGNMVESWREIVELEASDMFLEQMRNDENGVYGIAVDLSPEAPTIKMANLIEMSEIASQYPGQIPIDVFIKNSGLTNKDEIIAEIKRQQQQMLAVAGAADQTSVNVGRSA